LFEGYADKIAAQLLKAAHKNTAVADALCREAGYFQDNHHRMQCQELRGRLPHRQRDLFCIIVLCLLRKPAQSSFAGAGKVGYNSA
jgi:hypothetical protein